MKGGMYNIAESFGKLLDKLGVETHLNSEVVGIAREGAKVKGVRLKDGTFKSSHIIISNMEVIPAYNQLLNEEDKGFLADYEKKFEPSCSGLVIHLGVDREYPQLQNHNFFFSKNQKKHFDDVYNKKIIPDDPTIYLVAPTRTDKTLAPEGHEIIKILPHIPYIQEPPVEKGEYERLKERLYIKLERMGLENLRSHIVVEDMLIPDDIQRMYLSNKGSIYGIVADKKKNRGIRAPQRSERYNNLYFVGGSVNPGSGMPMVIYSGQMIKNKILDDLNRQGGYRE